jgi:hypothetical protein
MSNEQIIMYALASLLKRFEDADDNYSLINSLKMRAEVKEGMIELIPKERVGNSRVDWDDLIDVVYKVNEVIDYINKRR